MSVCRSRRCICWWCSAEAQAPVDGCVDVFGAVPVEIKHNGANAILVGIRLRGKSLKLIDWEEVSGRGSWTVLES